MRLLMLPKTVDGCAVAPLVVLALLVAVPVVLILLLLEWARRQDKKN